ncbi:MAG: hypothetical protein LBT40_07625 [Deltaproteobacteria bacterium]|nr:hypothetical protein [Deltaproteobacteria bacterium]
MSFLRGAARAASAGFPQGGEAVSCVKVFRGLPVGSGSRKAREFFGAAWLAGREAVARRRAGAGRLR